MGDCYSGDWGYCAAGALPGPNIIGKADDTGAVARATDNTADAAKTVAGVPDETAAVIRSIQAEGVIVQSGVKGPSVPRTFANDGRSGGQLLPTADRNGQAISYREWGTVPGAGHSKPGGERIVTGSNGSIYYTPDHYQTFIRWAQ